MNINTHNDTSLNTLSVNRVDKTVVSNTQLNNSLSEEQRQEIQQLKARDRVVRAHEAAHLAAGSGIARSGASFTYQRGPDGVQYAIGGEVQIDSAKVSGDPQATLEKARQIQAAALAPAQPSSQDRSVAAKAAQMAIEAQAEINQQRNEKNTQTHNTSSLSNDKFTGKLLDLTA